MIFLSFFAENSKNSPKMQKIRRKFAENSENSPKILKICRKFLKKEVFFEALISYRYRIITRKKTSYCIDIISSRKKSYRPGVDGGTGLTPMILTSSSLFDQASSSPSYQLPVSRLGAKKFLRLLVHFPQLIIVSFINPFTHGVICKSCNCSHMANGQS